MNYADQIRRARKRTGLRQDDLAQILGVHTNTIVDVENERWEPSDAQLAIVLNAIKKAPAKAPV